MMMGGYPAIFERILPLFRIFVEQVIYMGPVSNGQAAKIVNQVMVAGIAETVCVALSLAEQLKLPQ